MITLQKFLEKKPESRWYGDFDIHKHATRLLPQIIWCAQNSKLLTYMDMARDVRFPHKYRKFPVFMHASGCVAGCIGEYCQHISFPPLNALVINEKMHVPGDGVGAFLVRYGIKNYDNLETEEKIRLLDRYIYPLIFQPGIWQELLTTNDIEAAPPKLCDDYDQDDYVKEEYPELGEKIRNLPPVAPDNHEESQAHKLLKEYALNNCEQIDILRYYGCKSKNGSLEFTFPSLDKADVYFKNDEFDTACEIKSYLSSEDDILRGLFQCVKYEALLNAMNKLEGKERYSKCILIVQNKLTEDQLEIANTLGIPYVVLSQKKVNN